MEESSINCSSLRYSCSVDCLVYFEHISYWRSKEEYSGYLRKEGKGCVCSDGLEFIYCVNMVYNIIRLRLNH